MPADRATLRDLAVRAVHGWKDLLTTLPPVDGDGPLLVAALHARPARRCGGFALPAAARLRCRTRPASRRWRLLAVILLGTLTPAGADRCRARCSPCVALGWAAARPPAAARRCATAPAASPGSPPRSTLLAVALAGAVVVGPQLPGAGARARTVLRSYVEPPFDIGAVPQPAGRLPQVHQATRTGCCNQTLFTGHRLPAGTPVRIATLDAYNGSVWGAANQPQTHRPGAGHLSSASAPHIANRRRGTRHVTMTSHRRRGATHDDWLPTAGALTGVHFTGPRAERADRRTSATTWPPEPALVPEQAASRRPVHPAGEAAVGHCAQAESDALLSATDPSGGAAGFLTTPRPAVAAGPNSPAPAAARSSIIADYLRHTALQRRRGPATSTTCPGIRCSGSSNSPPAPRPARWSATTSSTRRPTRCMIERSRHAGPRRARRDVPNAHGVVEGKDVHAWVEVQLADGSWRTIPTTKFMNHDSAHQAAQAAADTSRRAASSCRRRRPGGRTARSTTSRQDGLQHLGDPAPRPAHRRPRLVAAAGLADGDRQVCRRSAARGRRTAARRASRAKAARRADRRHRGIATAAARHRLARAGRPCPGPRAPGAARRATRREQGDRLSGLGIGGLAHLADAHVFGPGRPDRAGCAATTGTTSTAGPQRDEPHGEPVAPDAGRAEPASPGACPGSVQVGAP